MSANLPEKAAASTASADPWVGLKQWTDARIALGRAGGSLPLRHLLDFRLSHALARDAVHQVLDTQAVLEALGERGKEALLLESAAADRVSFLQDPGLGRRLSEASRERLQQYAESASAVAEPELVILISDGLSARAAHEQVGPSLAALLPMLSDWRLAPLCVVSRARVALQDEVGQLLRARMALILLGERPGLGTADSLGAYLVYGPKVGNTDAERNCVSNIRNAGLPPAEAAVKLSQLLRAARRLSLSGVQLKDDSQTLTAEG